MTLFPSMPKQWPVWFAGPTLWCSLRDETILCGIAGALITKGRTSSLRPSGNQFFTGGSQLIPGRRANDKLPSDNNSSSSRKGRVIRTTRLGLYKNISLVPCCKFKFVLSGGLFDTDNAHDFGGHKEMTTKRREASAVRPDTGVKLLDRRW